MKLFTRTSLIVCLLIAFSCAEKEKERIQPDRVEWEVNDCLFNSITPEQRKKFAQEVNLYEQHLIEKNILASTKASDMYALIQKIADSSITDLKHDIDLAKQIEFLRESNSDSASICLQQVMETERFRESKAENLTREITRKQIGSGLNPYTISQAIETSLDPEDFELDYYRLNFLLSINSFKDYDFENHTFPKPE